MKKVPEQISKPYTPIQVEKEAKEHLQRNIVGIPNMNLGEWVKEQIYKKYPKKS